MVTVFSTKGFQSSWLSSSRVTRICCLISEKRIVRIRQNQSGQELCYRLFYRCSRRFYEIRQKEHKIERNLENNVVAIIFTGKALLSLHCITSTKPFLIVPLTLIHKLQDIFTFLLVSAILCCLNPFRSNYR